MGGRAAGAKGAAAGHAHADAAAAAAVAVGLRLGIVRLADGAGDHNIQRAHLAALVADHLPGARREQLALVRDRDEAPLRLHGVRLRAEEGGAKGAQYARARRPVHHRLGGLRQQL